MNAVTAAGPVNWGDEAGQLVAGFEMGLIPATGIVGGRGRVLAAVGGHSDVVTFFGEAELRAVARFTANAEAFAGWRWWSYSYLRGNYQSDLDAQLSGPTLGVNLRF